MLFKFDSVDQFTAVKRCGESEKVKLHLGFDKSKGVVLRVEELTGFAQIVVLAERTCPETGTGSLRYEITALAATQFIVWTVAVQPSRLRGGPA